MKALTRFIVASEGPAAFEFGLRKGSPPKRKAHKKTKKDRKSIAVCPAGTAPDRERQCDDCCVDRPGGDNPSLNPSHLSLFLSFSPFLSFFILSFSISFFLFALFSNFSYSLFLPFFFLSFSLF